MLRLLIITTSLILSSVMVSETVTNNLSGWDIADSYLEFITDPKQHTPSKYLLLDLIKELL